MNGRFAGVLCASFLVLFQMTDPVFAASNKGFERWIDDFRSRALAKGITVQTFDQAFVGVEYNATVINRDRNQAEFSKALWEYLDTAVSDLRIKNGRAALAKHRALLENIEATYGVEKEIVVAIWGLESAYGTFRGSTPVIEGLATLAYDGRRETFFESQLLAALEILQAGDVRPQAMTGSWAGAMGHTQFMPTSFIDYAVDFTGDNRRNIWSDDPSDALASTAAYLKHFGWATGQPWGVEVVLPQGFDYGDTGHEVKRSVADWTRLGVRALNGQPVPYHGTAALLMPAGAKGPGFLIFNKFNVLERYNTADSYVIAVGHLADRIGGGRPFETAWPREDRALQFAERKELQSRLTAAGFSTMGVDGKIGPMTISAIRAYQESVGMIPDGYANETLLKRLR